MWAVLSPVSMLCVSQTWNIHCSNQSIINKFYCASIYLKGMCLLIIFCWLWWCIDQPHRLKANLFMQCKHKVLLSHPQKTQNLYSMCSSGGQCYRLCDGRTLISNISSVGGLGSYHGLAADNRSQTYCLWILTTFPTMESYGVSARTGSTSLRVPNITLKLETDLNEYCSQVQWNFMSFILY